jgi:hypothetical protein
MMTAEQLIAAQKANLETLFGLTEKAFAGVEKMVELNKAAAKAARKAERAKRKAEEEEVEEEQPKKKKKKPKKT